MLFQDLRYAVRTLAQNPGFAALAVLCLALGIGVNATIFSVVDGVLLQPYPYADADRIVVLNSTNPRQGINRSGVSWLDFRDWRDQNATMAAMVAFSGRSFTISDGAADPERSLGSAVTWTLFSFLGTPPALGRDFRPDDDRPGAEPVVMLSDDLWHRRYNGDPAIVGKAVSLNGRPHTVISVMPPRFMFPQNQRLWVPLASYVEKSPRKARNMQVFAKLKPGVTMDQATTDLKGIATRLASTYPEQNDGWSAFARSLKSWMLPGDVNLTIVSMMCAATLVLLVACANVANLFLARASVRHREISIRSALGAGRWHIVRQLLTEAIVIGTLSAPLGILFARLGLYLLDQGIPPDSIPYFIHWALDVRSLSYTIGISVLTGIVFGLAPALTATRSNLQEGLREGGRGSAGGRRARLRNGLVIAEVSMSLVLLIGASLFVRSFLNLQNANVGFDTSPLMTLRFYMSGAAYESTDARARRVLDILRRVETVPGIQSVFASNFVPLWGGGDGGRVLVEGKSYERGKEPDISFIAASPQLRKTMGIALVRGRDITESEETTRTAVALINQRMARELWNDADPLGRRFRLVSDETPEWFTVVGVIADFRHFQGDTDGTIDPAAYVAYSFAPTPNTGLTIRATGDPTRITGAVRERIRQADASLPIFQVSTMEALRQRSFWEFKLFGWMFSVFGAIALLLASIGVYGVLSYSVSQRTQEIGVRVALGAAKRDVMRLVVGQGLRLALAGIGVGILGAFGVTRFIKTLLYNVTPTDPVSFSGVALFLVSVALMASYVPARRAMAVDPIVALRDE